MRYPRIATEISAYHKGSANRGKSPLNFPPIGSLKMQNITSRRALIKGGLIAGALVPAMGLIGNTAGAAALTPLDPNDPMAKAVKYAPDGSKVNASQNPSYKPTQKCANCAQYQGKASD